MSFFRFQEIHEDINDIRLKTQGINFCDRVTMLQM